MGMETEDMSTDELAKKTYSKVCSIDNRVEKIDSRLEDAESVTEPIQRIAGSAWKKVVWLLGWAVLLAIGVLGFWILKAIGKFKYLSKYLS